MSKISELAFAVFVINALSEAWGIATPKVYSLLKQSGALDNYIVPYYDVLHTCGREYLIDDLTGYLTDRGYKV
jgi:hypothetical protein